MPDALKNRSEDRSVSNESCFSMQVSVFPWSTEEIRIEFWPASGVCLMWECVSFYLGVSVVCESVCRAAKRTSSSSSSFSSPSSSAKDTSFLFVQCQMWRSFATDWSLPFWPEAGNKSGPPWGQSRGLYIALEPFQLYLLVGETHSAVGPLTLTRCCQNEGP